MAVQNLNRDVNVCVTVQTTHEYSEVLKLRIHEHYWLLYVKDYSFTKMSYEMRSVVYFMALYSLLHMAVQNLN